MTYNIFSSNLFEEDLNTSLDYIEFSLRNPQAADNLFDEVTHSIASLAHMPKRCAIVDDMLLAAQEIRSLAVKNHLIFFVVDETAHAVHLIRFLYGRSDWRSTLRLGNNGCSTKN